MQTLIAERRNFGRKSDMKEIRDKPQFSGFGYSVVFFHLYSSTLLLSVCIFHCAHVLL